jgi:L-iditol 2-dehydrogenase
VEETMKAAVYLGPGEIEVKDVHQPVCGNDEILIRVRACAVCGTDVRIYYFGQKNVVPPHIMGHEIAGTISKIGKHVLGYKVHDRVTVVTSVGCGSCKFCRGGYHNLCVDTKALGYYYQGGFAEYIAIPKEAVSQGNVLKFPEHLSFEEASLIEPLSCCINGQDYLNIQSGETVVVFGAGPIGCMHVELAKARGAERIILVDVSPARLRLAKPFSTTHMIDASVFDPVERVTELTDNTGADVVIVACSANKAQEQALLMAAKKARVSFFAGLPKDNPFIKCDSNVIHYKEVSVFGAFASYKEQYERATDLIATGRIDAKKFITATFSLDEIVKAIETTRGGNGLKAVVKM